MVEKLLVSLEEWRWEWDRANPEAAREVARPFVIASVSNPVLSEMLATSFEFESVTKALEIVTYNASLLYLMQLKSTLASSGELQEPFPPQDITRQGRRGAACGSRTPLLLPGEATTMWQPAIEALKAVPFITRSLAVTAEMLTFIPLAPLGIVYWTLNSEPELRDGLDTVLTSLPVFEDAQRVYAGYRVSVGGRDA
jgi:hypothetical protein